MELTDDANPGDIPLSLQGFSTDAFLADQQLLEETVARCMRGAGFGYSPRNYIDDRTAPMVERLDSEYANEVGLGIVSGLLSPATEGGEDPNLGLYDSLSPGEKEAWDRMLRGSPLVSDGSGSFLDPITSELVDPTYGASDGCLGQARRLVVDRRLSLFELAPEREALIAEYEADPRVVAARQDWETCMATKGFRATSLADLHRQIDEELGALRWDVAEVLFSLPIGEEATAAAIRDALGPESVARLDAIQASEIIAARAAVSCNEQLNNMFVHVLAEYERRFISENRSTLDAYAEARLDG